MDITALKEELASVHPGTGAYDADDAVAAAQLNAVNRTRPKSTMTGSEVLNQVVLSEWVNLSDAEKALAWDVVHLGELNPFGMEAHLLITVFGAGSETIAALAAARQETVSRAVEVGLGRVRVGHVQEARNYGE